MVTRWSTGVLPLDLSLEVLQKHCPKTIREWPRPLRLQGLGHVRVPGWLRSAVSAAPGQHHRHPRVKSSPCRCKRMGWRFRSGNGPEEFGTAGNRHGVSAWGAVPGVCSPGEDRDGDRDSRPLWLCAALKEGAVAGGGVLASDTRCQSCPSGSQRALLLRTGVSRASLLPHSV